MGELQIDAAREQQALAMALESLAGQHGIEAVIEKLKRLGKSR